MKEKLSKEETRKEIEIFFSDIKNKSAKEIKKMKKLAMKHNLKLGDLRKKFCKKCYSPDIKVKSIKNKIKTTECKICKNIMRWKIR